MVPSLIGFSYGGRDPGLAERLVPIVDYLEITPDDLVSVDGDRARLDPEVIAHLCDLAPDTTFVVHGVGLTIGTATGMSQTYLSLLDQLLDAVDVSWHSEHLGYTTVDGHYLGTMLTLPRTDETLDLLSERIMLIRERYGVPFLVENVAGLLPDPPGRWSAAGFLNELVSRTGCGLLLDAYNLECDQANIGLDVQAFLAELDLGAVAEMHVAGGIRHGRFQLDVHSQRLAPSTRTLAAELQSRIPGTPVTYEVLPQAVQTLGADAVIDEILRLTPATSGT